LLQPWEIVVFFFFNPERVAIGDATALRLHSNRLQPRVEATLGFGMKPLRGKEGQKMENEKWKMTDDK
jgi:hypothetical protein